MTCLNEKYKYKYATLSNDTFWALKQIQASLKIKTYDILILALIENSNLEDIKRIASKIEKERKQKKLTTL